MVDIPLPSTSAPGLRPSEGAGRLINAYVEQVGQGLAPDGFVRRRVPGVREFARTGVNGCRGMHEVSGVVLIAQDDQLVRLDDDGTVTVLGELLGTGPVTFASNRKSPTPDILCVTTAGVYECTISAAPTTLSDGDLPQPFAVCYIDGYFMMAIRDGRVFASGLNDTTFAALDFATAEGKPGGLYRAIPFGQQLYLMGPRHVEPWYNAANAEGFPFSRTTVIPLGLVSPFAVAGYEDGFSASLIFVANDRRVWRIDGGAPQVISTPDVDRALSAVDDVSQIRALCFAAAGHAQWAVTGPGFSWVFDLSTEKWHERASYLEANWRAAFSVNAFDRWLVGDATADHIGAIDENYHEEYEKPLVWTVITGHSAAFPNRLTVSRTDINMVVGQGLPAGREPIETRPSMRISYSSDGGNKYSVPVVRELGRDGQSRVRVNVNRCGMTGPQGRVWKYEVSDPVYVGLLSATQEIEARPR